MSIYILPNEILFYIGTFLTYKEQIIATQVAKRLRNALLLNIDDNQKVINWACTFWVKEENKKPVMAIVYPQGDYHRAKQHLNVLPNITTPGHIIYHSKKQRLIEHTYRLGNRSLLFKARNRRCYLKIIKKRAAFEVFDIDLNRTTCKNSLATHNHRNITTFIQDASILYPDR